MVPLKIQFIDDRRWGLTKSEIADFQDEGYLLDRPTVCWRRSYDGLCDKRKNCLVTENSSGIGQGIDTILVSSYTTGADIN